jgi:hypothetical protein
MLVCMGEPEDDDPAKVCSVSQGCGEFGINRLDRPEAPGLVIGRRIAGREGLGGVAIHALVLLALAGLLAHLLALRVEAPCQAKITPISTAGGIPMIRL